jgi:hypothetical protein
LLEQREHTEDFYRKFLEANGNESE